MSTTDCLDHDKLRIKFSKEFVDNELRKLNYPINFNSRKAFIYNKCLQEIPKDFGNPRLIDNSFYFNDDIILEFERVIEKENFLYMKELGTPQSMTPSKSCDRAYRGSPSCIK